MDTSIPTLMPMAQLLLKQVMIIVWGLPYPRMALRMSLEQGRAVGFLVSTSVLSTCTICSCLRGFAKRDVSPGTILCLHECRNGPTRVLLLFWAPAGGRMRGGERELPWNRKSVSVRCERVFLVLSFIAPTAACIGYALRDVVDCLLLFSPDSIPLHIHT